MAKESTLWDINEIQDSVTFTMADSLTYSGYLKYVQTNMDAYWLQDILDILNPWLKNKYIVLKSAEGEVLHQESLENFYHNKKKKGKDIYDFVAMILSHADNVRLVIGQSPACVREMIERLLKCSYLPADDVFKEVNGDKILSKRYGWSSDDYIVKYPWFGIYRMYVPCGYSSAEKKQDYLSINRMLYRILLEAYHEAPAMYRKDISVNEGLQVLLTEEEVVRGFPLFGNLFDQKIMTLGTNDKMTSAVIKKCAKLTGLNEFFPSSSDALLKNLRASFAFPFICYMLERRSRRKLSSMEDIFKGTAYSAFCFEPFLLLALPHVKGIRQFDVNLFNYHCLADTVWRILLRLECPDQWISVRALIYKILASEGGCEYLHLFSWHDYNSNKFKLCNKRFEDERIIYSNLRSDLMEPAVKGLLLMLASVGLLDVAYRDYDEQDRSYVDWMEYVRLTDLGRFVFKYSSSYEAKASLKSEECFDVDEDRLIIRSLQENNPYENFLQEVATPIGNHRYVFSEPVFMQKCSSPKNVEDQIDFLKRFIVLQPSPVWKDFFNRLIHRCSPLTAISSSYYTIYKLTPGDKELIHLFTSDEKLRSLVIRAEGYLILVEDENKDKFLRRMKALGYVL